MADWGDRRKKEANHATHAAAAPEDEEVDEDVDKDVADAADVADDGDVADEGVDGSRSGNARFEGGGASISFPFPVAMPNDGHAHANVPQEGEEEEEGRRLVDSLAPLVGAAAPHDGHPKEEEEGGPGAPGALHPHPKPSPHLPDDFLAAAAPVAAAVAVPEASAPSAANGDMSSAAPADVSAPNVPCAEEEEEGGGGT